MGLHLRIINTPISEWYGDIDSSRKLIGRGADSQIKIPPTQLSVSRQHAEIWRTDQTVYIRDVGSSAGTAINGIKLIPLREYKICTGDRLLIGELEMKLVDAIQNEASVLAHEPRGSDESSSTIRRARKGCEDKTMPEVILQLLTNAERDVVLWMSRGITDPHKVARILYRSPNTVRTQLNSIYQKLGVHSRDALLGLLTSGRLPNG